MEETILQKEKEPNFNTLTENDISKILLDIFIKVHRTLGPGLLESVYEEVICYELIKAGLNYKRQKGIPLVYEQVKLDIGFRADIIVENKVIIEIKSVELMAPVFHKQVITYLKLTNLKLGLLVNFNVPRLMDGYTRLVNKL